MNDPSKKINLIRIYVNWSKRRFFYQTNENQLFFMNFSTYKESNARTKYQNALLISIIGCCASNID